MKKIIAAIFVISVLVSCSVSKDSTITEKPDAPTLPVSPKKPTNNYQVK